MSTIYRIVVLGDEAAGIPKNVLAEIERIAGDFDLHKGDELEIVPGSKATLEPVATVGLFIGASPIPVFQHKWMLAARIPIIPIVSNLNRCSKELPADISHLNALALSSADAANVIASAALECIGLLPKQRRVFMSYVRDESRENALQLFDELSSRQFDVFIDTHDVRPGEAFQAVLWHRLCDSDVMVMLDSRSYFDRRWTREEFGRANLKKAAILRVAWPGVTAATSLGVTETLQLEPLDFDGSKLTKSALDRIGDRIEYLRSQSIAVRHANLVGTITTAVTELKGKVIGIGARRRIEIELPRGKTVLAYPALGVPSAETLHEVAMHAADKKSAIVYDHLGVHDRWLEHLSWLGENFPIVRWIQAVKVGWDLISWDAE
jgi:hypothetical protein